MGFTLVDELAGLVDLPRREFRLAARLDASVLRRLAPPATTYERDGTERGVRQGSFVRARSSDA